VIISNSYTLIYITNFECFNQAGQHGDGAIGG
jgi:hypothetical protein